MSLPLTEHYIVLAVASLISAAITYLITSQRDAKLGEDKPDLFRKSQTIPISRLGGLPIFLTLFASLATMRATGHLFGNQFNALLIANALIFLVGFVDDLSSKGARFKLAGQIIVALIAYTMGLRIELIQLPFLNDPISLGSLGLFLTLGWLVFVPNIINLIDGLDGLAGGVGIFLCIVLTVVGVSSQNPMVVGMSLAMMGSLIGFLFFNFPPARIYLGDGGAYLIGFFVASLSLASSHKGSVAAALLVVIVALGLPLMDTVFAILRRGICGLPLFRADAEHIHHRLVTRGFSKNRSLLWMYAITVVFGVVGLSIFWSRGQTLPIAGAIALLVMFAGARYLGYVRNWRTFISDVLSAWRRREEIQYALVHSDLLELEIERARSAEEFWLAFMESLHRVGLEHISHTEFRETGEEKQITLKMADQSSWNLRYYDDSRDNSYWIRVAKCFQRAYAGGIRSWGHFRSEPDKPKRSTTPSH